MLAPRARSPYPDTVSLSKLVLTEGETPANLFEALAVHLGIDKTIEIRSFGSKDNLRNVLAALVKSHGFGTMVHSLGIARDAENDATAARNSVQSAIHNASIPEHIKPTIMILPDNAGAGMMYPFCELRSTGR
jgi:hypothetical protein